MRYVLEGSIRRAGDRVRITAQLIDATTGAHRWAERYDRNLEDVFAVQDEVARTIVAILAAHVNKAEAERTLLKPPATWQAYDYYMRAVAAFASFHRPMQATDIYETRRLLEALLSARSQLCAGIRPEFPHTTFQLVSAARRRLLQSGNALKLARLAAEKAVQLDPTLPQAHAQLGYVFAFRGKARRALLSSSG